MNLSTLIHISDLHFGTTDPDTYDAEALKLWAAIPLLDGLLGHKYSALMLLESFWLDRRDQDEELKLIVTGDLTTKGNPAEFETAVEFLHDELVPPKGGNVGLGVKDWKDWTIPGNHDHWPGSVRMIGRPSPAFGKTFRVTPFVKDLSIPPATGKYLVKFLCIDTDFDVHWLHPYRVTARGSFVSQLDALREDLHKRDRNEIRVLCLHHSPAKPGYWLAIDSDSRRELHKLIVDKEISILLCGHVHSPPLVKAFTATSGSKSRAYLEARCGTTTQQDLQESPYYWKNVLAPLGVQSRRDSNSLLLYRITEEADGLYWDSELYELRPEGFLPPLNPKPGRVVDTHFKLV
jgi:3',5'-cyclic AMP phosphodiesterase CpdA